jgi:hypothetical protein
MQLLARTVEAFSMFDLFSNAIEEQQTILSFLDEGFKTLGHRSPKLSLKRMSSFAP